MCMYVCEDIYIYICVCIACVEFHADRGSCGGLQIKAKWRSLCNRRSGFRVEGLGLGFIGFTFPQAPCIYPKP